MSKKKYVRKVQPDMSNLEVFNLLRTEKLKKAPDNFWSMETSIELLRRVCLKERKFSRKEILENVTADFLREEQLITGRKAFNCSVQYYVIAAFPELDIHPWEFKYGPNKLWQSEDTRREFVLWIIEKENINVNDPISLRKISANLITKKYSSGRAITYSGGLYELVNLAIGGKFKEWEVFEVGKWTESKKIDALKWLIEEKLKLSEIEKIKDIPLSTFYEYNVGELISKQFNHSRRAALDFYINECFKK